MLKNWLTIAFSNYKKNWLTTVINPLGLSLGLTIFLLVFLNWQDEKSYENWIPDGENVYYIERAFNGKDYNAVSSYPFLEVSKSMFPEIENYSIINFWRFVLILAEIILWWIIKVNSLNVGYYIIQSIVLKWEGMIRLNFLANIYNTC